jgi:O-antigen/teichoic acid export membrane protein
LRAVVDNAQSFTIAAHGFRAVCLALYLLAGANLLGPRYYGILMAAASIAAIASTLVGLGSAVGMLRDGARDATAFSARWGATLAKFGLTGVAVAAAYVALCGAFLGHALGPIELLGVAISEIVLVPACAACSLAFMARGQIKLSAVVQVVPALARIVAVITLWSLIPDPSLTQFITTLTAWMFLMCGGVVMYSLHALPKPTYSRDNWSPTPDYNWVYMGSTTLNVAASEIDKAVVFKMVGATETGVYAAASRVLSALTIPISALIHSKSHYLFSLGARLDQRHGSFAQEYGAVFVIYSIAGAAVFVATSGVLAELLGPGFSGLIELAKIMAWWLPLNGIRQLSGALLTTTDKAGTRVACDVAGLALFLGTALVLAPQLGSLGAAYALLISEGFAAALATFLLFWSASRQEER